LFPKFGLPQAWVSESCGQVWSQWLQVLTNPVALLLKQQEKQQENHLAF